MPTASPAALPRPGEGSRPGPGWSPGARVRRRARRWVGVRGRAEARPRVHLAVDPELDARGPEEVGGGAAWHPDRVQVLRHPLAVRPREGEGHVADRRAETRGGDLPELGDLVQLHHSPRVVTPLAFQRAGMSFSNQPPQAGGGSSTGRWPRPRTSPRWARRSRPPRRGRPSGSWTPSARRACGSTPKGRRPSSWPTTSFPASTSSSGKATPVKVSAKIELKSAEERAALFEHAWRQTREKFYVENLHGVDWAALKSAYARFLPHLYNNRDFAELISEMQGELNASHTVGASARRAPTATRPPPSASSPTRRTPARG